MKGLYFFILLPLAAFAGPPFLVDDPDPGEFSSSEFSIFAALSETDQIIEEPFVYAPGIEANWTVLKNFQVHILIPFAWTIPTFNSPKGIGDTEIGFKYRFIQETEKMPQVAFAPKFELPTGNADRDLGNGRPWIVIPMWLQKTWGPWAGYAGGGWTVNNEPETRSFPFGGVQVQYAFESKLTLGIELYAEGAASVPGTPSVINNIGGSYAINKKISLGASIGRSIMGQERNVAYLGVSWANVK